MQEGKGERNERIFSRTGRASSDGVIHIFSDGSCTLLDMCSNCVYVHLCGTHLCDYKTNLILTKSLCGHRAYEHHLNIRNAIIGKMIGRGMIWVSGRIY